MTVKTEEPGVGPRTKGVFFRMRRFSPCTEADWIRDTINHEYAAGRWTATDVRITRDEIYSEIRIRMERNAP